MEGVSRQGPRCLEGGGCLHPTEIPPEPRRRRLLLLLNPFGGRGQALSWCQTHVLPMITEADISFNLIQTGGWGAGGGRDRGWGGGRQQLRGLGGDKTGRWGGPGELDWGLWEAQGVVRGPGVGIGGPWGGGWGSLGATANVYRVPPPPPERANHARELVTGISLDEWDGIVTVSGDGLLYEVTTPPHPPRRDPGIWDPLTGGPRCPGTRGGGHPDTLLAPTGGERADGPAGLGCGAEDAPGNPALRLRQRPGRRHQLPRRVRGHGGDAGTRGGTWGRGRRRGCGDTKGTGRRGCPGTSACHVVVPDACPWRVPACGASPRCAVLSHRVPCV